MELFNRKISINPRTVSFLRIALLLLLILVLVTSVFQPQSGVSAAAVLTITPLTWNVIGLDSNNVNVGPNNFPVGARVCNTGDAIATNVVSTFVWDSLIPISICVRVHCPRFLCQAWQWERVQISIMKSP